MEHVPFPTSLQATITQTYRRALRDVTESRAVPENHIRESSALSHEVFRNAVAELLTGDAAETFARMFAPEACTRDGCTNNAAFTDATFYEEAWCSRGCQQWERRSRIRKQRAVTPERIAV